LGKGQFLLSYDYIVFFSAHPFLFVCLCLAMITWLVTWEQMWIQVVMLMLSDRAGLPMGDFHYIMFSYIL